jgi:hypothetical protein
MATKIFCDRCDKQIYGYNSETNNIRFKKFIPGRGVVPYETDLCDDCMNKLVEFIEMPIGKEKK